MKKKKYGVYHLAVTSLIFRREYGINTFLSFGIPTINLSVVHSFIRWLEE